MDEIKKFVIKHLAKADYRIFIPDSVNRLGFLILHIERNVVDMKIVQLGYDPEKKANTLDVHLCAEEFQQAEQEECKRYIAHVVTYMLPELEEPAMVSHKDHELIEDVLEELTKFYEEDAENRGVVCLIADKNTDKNSGMICGNEDIILSAIEHCFRKVDISSLTDILQICLHILREKLQKEIYLDKTKNEEVQHDCI